MLSKLCDDPEVPGSLIGSTQHEGNRLTVRITPDGDTIEACLMSVQSAVSILPKINDLAKKLAADEFLAKYNDSWRHYSTVKDGVTVDVSEPELDALAFKTRLKMTCLEAVGANGFNIFFDDGGMFWGHSIVVSSFDGPGFTGTAVELFG